MSTSYSTLCILRLASGHYNTSLTRALPAAKRDLTISYPVFKANAVDDMKVPTTVYTPEGKLRAAIPVAPKERTGPAVPKPNEMEELTTLSDEVYKVLPATVKAMTVMGKVIVVTG